MLFVVWAVLGAAIAVSVVLVLYVLVRAGCEERTLAPGGSQLLYLTVHLL
jgi:hypothetical protein